VESLFPKRRPRFPSPVRRGQLLDDVLGH
jgi:hypothetical protein